MPKNPTTPDSGGSTTGKPPSWLPIGGPFAELEGEKAKRFALI